MWNYYSPYAVLKTKTAYQPVSWEGAVTYRQVIRQICNGMHSVGRNIADVGYGKINDTSFCFISLLLRHINSGIFKQNSNKISNFEHFICRIYWIFIGSRGLSLIVCPVFLQHLKTIHGTTSNYKITCTKPFENDPPQKIPIPTDKTSFQEIYSCPSSWSILCPNSHTFILTSRQTK